MKRNAQQKRKRSEFWEKCKKEMPIYRRPVCGHYPNHAMPRTLEEVLRGESVHYACPY